MNAVLNDVKIQKADIKDLPWINQLLQKADLPLVEPHEFNDYFFVFANKDHEVFGAIGLEIYGYYGLLRSMVVHPDFRNNGMASALVDQIMQTAEGSGLQEVFLLTSTAEKYFLRKGFQFMSRENCPLEIKQSREYSSICPVSSFLMSKKITK